MSLVLSGNSGSLTVDSSAGITFPAGGNPQAAPSSVIQVVSNTLGTNFSTTSGTYADTGITATITPKFSTSKILVLITFTCASTRLTSNQSGMGIVQLLRNGSVVNGPISLNRQYILGAGGGSNALLLTQTGQNYVDSPATTSSTTYKLQAIADTPATDTFYVYTAGTSIVLMEIAA
jgi:hypothetical protein